MHSGNKKNFYKTKGFYISCFIGLFAILGVIGLQNAAKPKEYAETKQQENIQNQQNLPETDPLKEEHNLAAIEEEHGEPVDLAKIEETASPVETSPQTEQTPEQKALPDTDSSITTNPENLSETEETNQSVSVLKTEDQYQGLTWPVSGTIVLSYSMDKSIYFPTLGQYKCNPALMIAGAKGDPVVSACDSTITDITTSKETGLTITAQAGDFTYIYGQLEDTSLSKGDTIKEGERIGTLAEPTSYYTKEGCHLYFQILENGENVNPLLLLK